MAPRFPGMDPFVEGQHWEDFHSAYINVMREILMAQIAPKYVALIEERVYLEHKPEHVRPDVAIAPAGRGVVPGSLVRGPAPLTLPLPIPEQMMESCIEIRLRDGRELVTVIELLSPTNKRPHADGRGEYLAKRERVLRSFAHLVELDLLRGGERLPVIGDLPTADGYVFVSRVRRRPLADIWPLHLRDPLPSVPVPLLEDDPEVELDLQSAFQQVYDRARYDVILNYQRPLAPPMSEDDAAWIRTLLAQRG
ncbi:MAG TPA: DUF4058 family protein [Candidatus Xenobia bacterium]